MNADNTKTKNTPLIAFALSNINGEWNDQLSMLMKCMKQ